MSESSFNQQRFQQAFLILLVIAISAFFISMIRQFLMTLFFAALFSAILHPVYRRLRKWFRGRTVIASLVTLVIAFFLVIGPFIGLISIVGSQAYEVTQTVPALVDQGLPTSEELDALISRLPFSEELRPYQDQITEKLAEFAGNVGNFLFNGLRTATAGTATFFFHFFVMLYAMFFFLISGESTLRRILYFMPLSHEDESLMLDRFVSVTLATVKGTLLIGGIQGTLAGVAFAFFGIKSAAFWGTIMAILSVIPALGPAIVWIPAVVYLFITGETGAAIGLGLWCALVVSLVDNFLRPWLVGKEAKMSDLMVLLSTLGGLGLFGIVGFIVGPLIAAIFQTVWDIYGVAFKDVLPATYPIRSRKDRTIPQIVIPPALPEQSSDSPPRTAPPTAPINQDTILPEPMGPLPEIQDSTEEVIDIWLPSWSSTGPQTYDKQD